LQLEKLDVKLTSLITSLRLSLKFSFITLIVTSAFVISLIMYSASKLNDYSEKTSQALFDSVLNKEYEDLGKLVKDYSFWDDAVERLIIAVDQTFVAENFLGPYLTDTFDISNIAIFRPDGSIAFSIHEGELEETSSMKLNSNLRALMNSVSKTDMTNPSPATGTVLMDGKLYNVALAAITPFDEKVSLDINRLYGFMLMAKPLNENKISKWMKNYGFQKMQLQLIPSVSKNSYIHHPIASPSGPWIANIIWQPNYPGNQLISEVKFWIIGLFLFVLLMTLRFILQIRKYTRMTVDSAIKFEGTYNHLEKIAHYDPITNLPNRSLAIDRLAQSLSSGHRNNSLTAVLFVDLDGFKSINDSKGHDVGDQVLMLVGERLLSCIRKNDTASRIGGDEFIIILNDVKHPDDAGIVANNINEKLSRDFMQDNDKLTLSASIGIAIAPTDSNDPIQLIKNADIAMYLAKNNGKNCYKFFTIWQNHRR
jgi:diguanylate cyclase (GGDEF)-like protein